MEDRKAKDKISKGYLKNYSWNSVSEWWNGGGVVVCHQWTPMDTGFNICRALLLQQSQQQQIYECKWLMIGYPSYPELYHTIHHNLPATHSAILLGNSDKYTHTHTPTYIYIVVYIKYSNNLHCRFCEWSGERFMPTRRSLDAVFIEFWVQILYRKEEEEEEQFGYVCLFVCLFVYESLCVSLCV